MIATLRSRDFALLWTAGLISVACDFALIIALPLHAYALTGSAIAIGGVFTASLLPRVLLGSIAGVFVDRWDRKRLMVAADLLYAPRSCCRCWLWVRPISSGCSIWCERPPVSSVSSSTLPNQLSSCPAWYAKSGWSPPMRSMPSITTSAVSSGRWPAGFSMRGGGLP